MDEKSRLPGPVEQDQRRTSRLRFGISSLLGLLLTAVLLVALQTATWPWTPAPVKTNIILMISDGFGPASVTFSRHFYQALHNDTSPDSTYQSPLDKILVGTHRSRSASSLITDSAAGATAFACARKSYNGAIGVTADGKPCGTVFEAAKRRGLLTGVVVTSRLTDATPACFVAHAASRAEEPLIASQMIGGDQNPLRERTLDLAIGGGGCAFLPKSSPYSCRQDEEDTVEYARQLGWDVRLAFPATRANTSEDHNAAHVLNGPEPRLPFMALLAPSNTPYEIDRVSLPTRFRPPSLAELSDKALEVLSRAEKNDKGFLLMIEGSQIDLCAHNNDPACHAREAIAYQKAIARVTQWVDKHNSKTERTLLISTSDHETGGVTLGRQLSPEYPNYAYYPQRLLNAKHSTPVLTAILIDYVRKQQRSSHPHDDQRLQQFIAHHILGDAGLGFHTEEQGGPPTRAEIQLVLDAVKAEFSFPLASTAPSSSAAGVGAHHGDAYFSHPGLFAEHGSAEPPPITLDVIRRTLSDIAAKRAEIGFSTSGHTGVDINVYAHGYAAHLLAGNQDNTHIATTIQSLLHLDLDAVTRDLNK